MIPRVLVNGLLQADWFEPIAVHVNGLPFTSEGSLAVAIDATVDHVHNGIPFDLDGRVCVEEGSAAYHLAGRAYTANNRLLVDIFGTQANALAGLPLTSAGALAVEMFASATFALDFARDQYSTLSPALTVSSPTGGVMVPDYLGNYHTTLANEIPIRGGRRLYNLLTSTDTLATQGVTVEAADYWLSFKGSGSVAVSGVATDSLAGTGANDRVSKKVTMGSAGTATFTVTGSVTEAYLYKSRPGQTTADPEYVSRGVLSSPYHGYGVDGLAWMRTDPSGLVLADAASGYPVLCTGIADWPQITNLMPYSTDFSNTGWQALGGTSSKSAYVSGPIVGKEAVELVCGAAGDRLEFALSGLTTSAIYTVSFLVKASIETDILFGGIAGGVPTNSRSIGTDYQWVDVSEAASTTTRYPQIRATEACTLTVAACQVEAGSARNPLVITDGGLAVTADAIASSSSKAGMGVVENEFTIVLECIVDAPVSGNRHILAIRGDADNRVVVYHFKSGANRFVGIYVETLNAVVWSETTAVDWADGETLRIALRIAENNGSLVINGEEVFSTSSLAVPVTTALHLYGDPENAGSSGSVSAVAIYEGA